MADWHLWLPPALAKPRFRYYAAGHSVSVVGGWIQQVALAWLVFRLSGSTVLLGVTGFLLNIFYLLLGPFAGAATDRFPKLQMLIVIDLILAACAGVLAVLAGTNVTYIPAYLAIAAVIGIANAFEMTVRQTLIRDIVEERALISSALGVSAMLFNCGRMVGPAIAGLALAYVSEAWCFAVNAVSFGAIIIALLAMRLPESARVASGRSKALPRGLFAGWSVLVSFPAVRYLLPTVVALGLFATPYVPLMPSIAAGFFDGRSSTVGWLMSAAGFGALGSAAYLSLQPGYSQLLRLQTLAPLVTGAVLIAFAWSRTLPVSMLLLAALAATALIAVNSANAMLQQSVPDEWRGRAIGLYSMSFAGTAPLGGLLAGFLAEHIGIAATLTMNGCIIVAAGLVGRWRLHNHPEAVRGLMRSLMR